MTNKLRRIIILCFGLGSVNAYSQDFTDALRYSNLSSQGTARSMGFGGALGSIGGDFSSLSVNPAGIGIYRTSELVVTPSLKINGVDGQYAGTTNTTNNTRFNFNNFSYVYTHAKKGIRYEQSKWKSFSIGLGVNRLADFNRDYVYSGTNTQTSATNLYAANATQYGDGSGLGFLGYQSYLTNYDSATGVFKSALTPSTGLKQTRTVSERGGIYEYLISFGGNYDEKLMLGGTIGFPVVNYSRSSTYSESSNDPNLDFRTYSLYENLNTTGGGINLKLGAIYKFTNDFRIGAAIHSPTYYSLHDESDLSISSRFTTIGVSNAGLNHNSFDYTLTTPWRAILSASYIVGKYGFITADYEYVDYSSSTFHYSSDFIDDQRVANDVIKTTLQSASNFRIGAEGRISSIFYIRAGFGYYGNPYKVSYGIDGSSTSIAGGLGFRFTHFFIDAALTHTQYNNPEQLYGQVLPTDPVAVANIKSSLNNAALTIGFKF